MEIDRYQRQMLISQIGEAGQHRLGASRVLLVGCGALGSVIAEQLVRAGVGRLRIVDRDVVELSNLQRQVLFDESDAHNGLPKAVAAAQRLGKINSTVTIEPVVADVDSGNVEQFSQGHDLVVDGTDNVETRYLLNDVAVKHSLPWIYGACVAAEGRVMTIIPGHTPCLRCIFPQPPEPGELQTCDTAGVLGPVAGVIASMQSLAAIKLLSGNAEAIGRELLTFDLWNNRVRAIVLTDAKRDDCPTCARREFTFLNSTARDLTVRLCGRNAVQLRPAKSGASRPLDESANRLRSIGSVTISPFLVRCELPENMSLTIFADGRTIVRGTSDTRRARSIVARYLGA